LRICYSINVHAGSAAKSSIHSIAELFAAHGFSPRIIEPKADDDIVAPAKEAIEQKYDVAVTGGGDGTANVVASALVGNDAVRLGIIPLGTLAHFACDAEISTDLSLAVDNIILGEVKSVDVGAVNGEIFLNNSSVGLYSAIVKLREGLQQSGYAKWSAAIFATIRIMARFRRLHLVLHSASGSTVKRRTALLFVGNNAYETGLLQIGKRLELDQGKLWIAMPNSSSRWPLFIALVSEMVGRKKKEDVCKSDATHLVVASNQTHLQVAIDGEVRHLKPPLNYKSRPKALRIIAPRTTGEVG
jgi:diacylglycerol kinase family enzyme